MKVKFTFHFHFYAENFVSRNYFHFIYFAYGCLISYYFFRGVEIHWDGVQRGIPTIAMHLLVTVKTVCRWQTLLKENG